MKFNVAQLLKAVVGTSRVYTVDDEIPSVDEVPAASKLLGNAKFTRTPRGILVEADLRLSVTQTCSRCLEDVVYPLHLQFSEEFQPTVDVVTGASLPNPEDENVFAIDHNHILDMTGAVREYVLLNLPMQVLCSEDCRGLCSTCGQNLNRDECNCSEPPVDSRLAILRDLLQEQSEE
jgi:uncharacterized protein